MIEFQCTACGQMFRAKPESMGKTGKCRGCGAVIEVPMVFADPVKIVEKVIDPQPIVTTPQVTREKMGGFYKGGACIILAFVAMLTAFEPPSMAVIINYLCVFSSFFLLASLIVPRISNNRVTFWIACIAAGLAASCLWFSVDAYTIRWESDDRQYRYSDTYTRSGRHIERGLSVYANDGSGRLGAFYHGPMNGDPPKRHGHWVYSYWDPFVAEDKWFWYSEEISQGEWELRNRK